MVPTVPRAFNDGQMDSVVAALEGASWVLNDSQNIFHTAKAVREMLGNKRSRRSGGTVHELPTLARSYNHKNPYILGEGETIVLYES